MVEQGDDELARDAALQQAHLLHHVKAVGHHLRQPGNAWKCGEKNRAAGMGGAGMRVGEEGAPTHAPGAGCLAVSAEWTGWSGIGCSDVACGCWLRRQPVDQRNRAAHLCTAGSKLLCSNAVPHPAEREPSEPTWGSASEDSSVVT